MTTFKMNQNTESSIQMEPTLILQEESEEIDEAIKTEEQESVNVFEEKSPEAPVVITDESIENDTESDEGNSQETTTKTKPSLIERLTSIFHF